MICTACSQSRHHITIWKYISDVVDVTVMMPSRKLFWDDMPHKAKTDAPNPLGFGQYLTSNGVYMYLVLHWHTFLTKIYALAPNGVVNWSCLNKALCRRNTVCVDDDDNVDNGDDGEFEDDNDNNKIMEMIIMIMIKIIEDKIMMLLS